jgi:dTDP-4-dehydrorhamnose 3,5-epimerase
MKVIDRGGLEGPCLLEPKVFGDERGFFFESFSTRAAAELALPTVWVQDNHSRSAAGVVRGLHWQLPPQAQDKWLRVIAGAILDVIVDIRRSSPTFGRSASFALSAHDKRMLFVPKGFAHGFVTLAEGTEVLYKVTAGYAPDLERGLAWDDPALAIEWPIPAGVSPTLSPRDQTWPRLADIPMTDLFS